LRYRAKFGPRGVLHTKATDKDDATEDPRFGKVGKQTIEDSGPLTKKRMETIDDETSAAAIEDEWLQGERRQLQGTPGRLRPVAVPAQRQRNGGQELRREERLQRVLLHRRRR
jgi:hypothetical protein